ncbi:hypothetical protein MFERI15181_00345 [Mycoplasma feriruminatoris]|uniref:Uncharacterized protein n=1 Tax=Mycoplasma feriruminatoris TaxID=1179777 RepID=A0ABY8HUY0_9MOLU|nr:hypothetical protein [Mycoplasma feriruminatoris]WFQ93434.1 hypothetical protein MFERI15181_00345 [Mycoplasma feriruminatoris]
MKKLLFLLSNSILFSLSALFIYNLNPKNNSENSSFVLKQEENNQIDLKKFFDDRRAYISIKDRDDNPKPKILNTLKGKYSEIDYSELDIEIETPRNGGLNVVLKPKSTSKKYINTANIPCYPKEDVEVKLKEAEKIETLKLNDQKSIFEALKKIGLTDYPEADFTINNIRETSARLVSTDFGDFYGDVEIQFSSIKKTLSSIIYDTKIKLDKPIENEIDKLIKEKYSSLKNENLNIELDQLKKTIKVTATNKEKFEGFVTLTFELNQQIIEPKVQSKNEQNSKMSLDKTKSGTNKPYEEKNSIDEVKPKNQPKSPSIESQPIPQSDLSNSPTSNQPESNSDKTMNYNPPVIDKSLKSNSNTSNLQIPNKESSNSKTGSKGSKTGVIVGSTLGVSGVVVTGAIGSWIYFKKRK